jgi:hypothetical protein
MRCGSLREKIVVRAGSLRGLLVHRGLVHHGLLVHHGRFRGVNSTVLALESVAGDIFNHRLAVRVQLELVVRVRIHLRHGLIVPVRRVDAVHGALGRHAGALLRNLRVVSLHGGGPGGNAGSRARLVERVEAAKSRERVVEGVAERRARRAGTKRGDADARGDAERGADAERGEAAAAGRARRVVALDDGQQRGVLVRGHGARVFSLSALFGRTEEARGANRRSKRRRFLVARRSAGNDASRELDEPRVRREPRVARCSLWGTPADTSRDTRSA